MTTAPNDIERRVIEVIENTINELKVLGLSQDAAIELLLIQAAVRLPNGTTIKDVLQALM